MRGGMAELRTGELNISGWRGPLRDVASNGGRSSTDHPRPSAIAISQCIRKPIHAAGFLNSRTTSRLIRPSIEAVELPRLGGGRYRRFAGNVLTCRE